MNVVKFSNGEAHIKEFCSRKLRKDMNKALWNGIETDIETDANGKPVSRMSGNVPLNMDAANDVAMLGMIDKLIIDGKEVAISIDALDNLPDADFNKIFEAVNKVTTKELPKA